MNTIKPEKTKLTSDLLAGLGDPLYLISGAEPAIDRMGDSGDRCADNRADLLAGIIGLVREPA